MKKSELRKLIKEVIKEQVHSAVSQYHNTDMLSSNFTNRVNDYGCGKLMYARFKINRKMSGHILNNYPTSVF